MAGIMVYRCPEDSSYVSLHMQDDGAFNLTMRMIKASGVYVVSFMERISYRKVESLNRELDPVLTEVNTKPIPLSRRNKNIESLFSKI